MHPLRNSFLFSGRANYSRQCSSASRVREWVRKAESASSATPLVHEASYHSIIFVQINSCRLQRSEELLSFRVAARLWQRLPAERFLKSRLEVTTSGRWLVPDCREAFNKEQCSSEVVAHCNWLEMAHFICFMLRMLMEYEIVGCVVISPHISLMHWL